MGKILACLFFVTVFAVSIFLFSSTETSAQKKNLQLGTFTPGPTAPVTPSPTRVPTNPPERVSSPVPGTKIPVTTPKIGQENGIDYCIDDVDPDRCDDNSSHLVPKGVGGVSGPCGTVIEQTHKLVDALPQYMKGLRDKLTRSVSNCGYSTGPASGYISTYLVIDAYNLAGFKDLSKNNPSHVSPSGLFSWWSGAPPSGYEYIPYTTQVVRDFGEGKRDLTGCVMFLKTSSSYHIGIVNKLELYSPNGFGVISILQSGTRMYIDRFPVASWSIKNTSTNQTVTSGVTGFGCHT